MDDKNREILTKKGWWEAFRPVDGMTRRLPEWERHTRMEGDSLSLFPGTPCTFVSKGSIVMPPLPRLYGCS